MCIVLKHTLTFLLIPHICGLLQFVPLEHDLSVRIFFLYLYHNYNNRVLIERHNDDVGQEISSIFFYSPKLFLLKTQQQYSFVLL